MLCESCRQRVDEADEFVSTMRAALRLQQVRSAAQERTPFWRRWFGVPAPVWAGALAAVALVAVLAPWPQSSPAPFAVQLETYRGAGTPAAAQAPAGRPIVLEVDAKGLPPAPAYRIELANAQGARVWESVVELEGETLNVGVDRSLGSGQYWVRIYRDEAPEGGELLREFSLRID
ncbi:MAG: hypothetical protein KIT09_35225 [Bryobacteraceae bacterium]|nr:hypothetical protein [Bryobacteraceae bacterium]